MSCEVTNSASRYIFTLIEHVIMTNIACSECFNKKYNHRVIQFIPIPGGQLEEWNTMISAYLPIKCDCKKQNS